MLKVAQETRGLLSLLPQLACAAMFLSGGLIQFAAAKTAGEEEFVFETGDERETRAFKGSFEVPENRRANDSRMIPIHYVRFPATVRNAGPPIVYLAGGPGGSGIMTAKYRRYAMFMALRKYGDVIALDQRGTGASNILPECVSKQTLPANAPISDQEFVDYHRKALLDCLATWKEEGVDIAGYNTVENVHDLDALRRHLGADKIVLWGTSYGSHLALAALKEIEDKIEKVVISSAEGLNQTIKMPARTDRYLDRLQAAIDSQPDAKAAYPDIKALLHRVHVKLDDEPMLIRTRLSDGSTVDYLLQRRDMQQIASGFISDPQSAALGLNIYRALDKGIGSPFENVPVRVLPDRFVDPEKPISMQAMPVAMDIASGMTKDRGAEIARQAQTATLKDYLNFTYHFAGIAPELDLGDDFRAKPGSNVPVLLFSGTLDGRTYVESQLESVSELENLTSITVRNAGHNLFMSSSEVQEAINRFMEDQPPQQDTITVELPNMAPQ